MHAFTVVAERCSASRAASQLLRVQSAAVPTERGRSGMRPMPAGTAVLERGLRVVAELRGPSRIAWEDPRDPA